MTSSRYRTTSRRSNTGSLASRGVPALKPPDSRDARSLDATRSGLGEAAGRIPHDPKLVGWIDTSRRDLRSTTRGARARLHGGARAVRARRARPDSSRHQGGARARAVRDDSPVPGRQRTPWAGCSCPSSCTSMACSKQPLLYLSFSHHDYSPQSSSSWGASCTLSLPVTSSSEPQSAQLMISPFSAFGARLYLRTAYRTFSHFPFLLNQLLRRKRRCMGRNHRENVGVCQRSFVAKNQGKRAILSAPLAAPLPYRTGIYRESFCRGRLLLCR